jgi:hypothetical protein
VSNHIGTQIKDKKIVRYTVSWLKEGETMNRTRGFKGHQPALDHFTKMGLMGNKDVGFFKNTKTFKTERLL